MRNVSSLFSIEPILIELLKDDGDKLKTNEELCQEAYDALESMFLSCSFHSILYVDELFRTIQIYGIRNGK